jgi:REP element-mobilizing transposase RayT
MNHVHAVVQSETSPERVMNDLKSFASRRLNELGFDDPNRKRWARHGSTRRLWKRESVFAAIIYVIEKQGEKMATYEEQTV